MIMPLLFDIIDLSKIKVWNQPSSNEILEREKMAKYLASKLVGTRGFYRIILLVINMQMPYWSIKVENKIKNQNSVILAYVSSHSLISIYLRSHVFAFLSVIKHSQWQLLYFLLYIFETVHNYSSLYGDVHINLTVCQCFEVESFYISVSISFYFLQ